MWVAWFHVFHCSGIVRLVPDRVATPLPAAPLLLREFIADVTRSSVACTIIVTLISCLLCRNLAAALYMLHYDNMMALPYLRRLGAGVLPWRPGFRHRPVREEFMVAKWHWIKFSREYFGFLSQFSFHLMLNFYHLSYGDGTVDHLRPKYQA
jgi:hypothetical protein